MASSPLKAEARWSRDYSRKRKAIEEEYFEEEEEDWDFDDADEEHDDIEDGDLMMEPTEHVDGLQLLLTAIERKESSASSSHGRKQSPVDPAPSNTNLPDPGSSQPNQDQTVNTSGSDASPSMKKLVPLQPTTPVTARYTSLPPSSPLSAPPTPRSASVALSDQSESDDEPDVPHSPCLSRSSSIPPPSSPVSQSSPSMPSPNQESLPIKSEEAVDATAAEEPASSSPPEPVPAVQSPAKSSPSRRALKSPTKSHTERDELNSEIAGLIVTILAFGTKTSMTAPDLADAVITQNPYLLEKLSKSLAVLTESGANASTPGAQDEEPKGKGKGKAKAKPKQTGKGKRGKRSGKANDTEFQAMLSAVEVVLKAGKMFGRIERVGEDAAGDPLLPTFHYEPDQDPDQDRAMTIQAAGVRTKRRATKHHVQYHWAPVSLNRFELAAECDDDD